MLTKTAQKYNILYCGKLQHECIPELLCAADFFILPTKAEGCCNAIIAAMACGLPILCSDVCDNPSIVKGGINGDLFDPTDPIDICNKMKQFIQSDAKSKKNMGIKSRLIAEQLFSQQEFLDKYVELIKS